MAIVKMKKLTLAAAACDADTLMQKLMWTGSVEVTDAAASLDGDKSLSPSEKSFGRFFVFLQKGNRLFVFTLL